LNELDSGTVTIDVAEVADQVEASEELTEADAPALVLEHEAEASAPVATESEAAAPKRRGRPPGSGKKVAVAKGEPKRRGRPPGAKAKVPKTPKQAAAKKKGGNKAAQAREIIATWSAKGWARKDIIGKLIERLELSPATASTYYQNYK